MAMTDEHPLTCLSGMSGCLCATALPVLTMVMHERESAVYIAVCEVRFFYWASMSFSLTLRERTCVHAFLTGLAGGAWFWQKGHVFHCIHGTC